MTRSPMHRRSLLTLLGGASAAAWPLAARAQQQKRVGVLMNGTEASEESRSRLPAFAEGLRKLGWIEGQNLRTEVRWSGADVSLMQAYATDLVRLFQPDVLLAVSSPNLIAMQRATSVIPIVFTQVTDPVEQGLVPNLRRPGG